MQKKILASAIVSELQSSDIHMTVKARLFDLATNLNGVRVTEAFMDEIVAHEDKYVCIPLCADVRGLLANKTIGHMYNSRTGEFHSTMIGSFYHFEKQVADGNAYLVGYARMPKRNKAICKAVSELFAQNALKFSFEISCGECSKQDDGTILIDVSDKNYIEGEAIVTFPACEDAVALELVAECLGKGDENMPDANNEIVAEDTIVSEETTENVNVENQIAEEATVVEETASNNEPTENSEQVTASEETASTMFVTTEHTETDSVSVYDIETDAHTTVKNIQIVTTHEAVEVAEETIEETAACKDDKKENAAEDEEPEATEEEEEQQEETAQIETSSEEVNNNINSEIEALKTLISELQNQIAELRSSHETEEVHEDIISEVKETAHVNPFMAEMTAPVRYSLLEKEEKPSFKNKYSLLERA